MTVIEEIERSYSDFKSIQESWHRKESYGSAMPGSEETRVKFKRVKENSVKCMIEA